MSVFGRSSGKLRVGRGPVIAVLASLAILAMLFGPVSANGAGESRLSVLKPQAFAGTWSWTGTKFANYNTPTVDQEVVVFASGLTSASKAAAATLRSSSTGYLRAKVSGTQFALEDSTGVLQTVARSESSSSGALDVAVVGNSLTVKWNGAQVMTHTLTKSYTGTACGIEVWQDVASSVTVGGVCAGIGSNVVATTTTSTPTTTSAPTTTKAPTTTTTVNTALPSAVASMTLDSATTNSMRLSWTAPASSGTSAVAGYVIGWTESGTGRSWDSSLPGYALTASPLTLTGLVAGTSYSVRIAAVNSSGKGAVTTKTYATAGASTTPTTSVTTTVVPPAPPSNGALPAKLVAGYWQMWQGPNVSEITAAAPQYNLQYAAFALGTGGNNGTVAFNPVFESPANLKADIAASKAKGSTWLLSIGGGSETGLRLLNSTHVDQFVNSIIPIIDNYGFQGIDWDLEGGSSQWTVDAVKSATLKLEARYGTNFVVSAAPRPYEDQYRTLAVALGASLDLFGFQFYDFPETRDTAFLTNYVDSRINQAISMGIPASKIMIGAITYTQYNLGWNTVAVYRDIWKQQVAKHPDLRGMYIWETSLDKKENWSFAKTMGPAVRGVN